MKKGAFGMLLVAAFVLTKNDAVCQAVKLDTGWYHLRNGDPREWAEFSKNADARKLTLHFSAFPDNDERTLSIRQYDVKQEWKISLNGNAIGALLRDEKDLISYFPISSGELKTENTLEISCADAKPDDIKVGQISLHNLAVESLLSQAQMALTIFDIETQEKIPARITIVNEEGTLQPISSTQGDVPARPGYVYTGNRTALIGLPAGTYTLYATRGFEYGVDSVQLILKDGDFFSHDFYLKREVPTRGWASCDTHIHTYTWSRHGDATAAERVLTIAGENIELPVITDHNIQVDLKPFAIEENVVPYFTPITGNEVTTAVGHFNVFPLSADDVVINHRGNNWKTIQQNIMAAGNAKAIVLNHGRDIHLKFRPLDPVRHLSDAGMRLDNADFIFNAMEVVNSGAQKTDQRELIRDWFGMLNHGELITPVGSSDSHDVSRYFVGQARTFIRCNDDDPSNIDLKEVITNFLEGNVMVSFGLLAEIEVNDAYGPGELVPASGQVKVSVKVSGPSWTRAGRVELYANGQMIREEKIEDQNAAGVKWSGIWNLTLPPHDIFLVALASGPGDQKPFWPIAKPYQPDTPEWNPIALGLSGATWIDADRNGIRNCAKDYAEKVYREAGSDIRQLVHSLAAFDEAVSAQAAAILHRHGKDLAGKEVRKALERASPQTKSAFQKVITQLQEAEKIKD